jgi:hypothetical protein
MNMAYVPLNIGGFVMGTAILHFYGILLGLLLFNRHLRKLWRNYHWSEAYFSILGLGLGANTIIGYILDIFWEISIENHVIGVLILGGLWIGRDFKTVIPDFKKFFYIIKERGNIRRNNHGSRSTQDQLALIGGLVAIFYAAFMLLRYSLAHYSIVMQDPIQNMERLQISLRFGHFYWGWNHPYISSFLNHSQVYPGGFYYNIILTCIYGPENLYLITRFLGPLTIIGSVILVYLILEKITHSPFAAVMGMLAWMTSNIIMITGTLSISSNLGLLASLIAILSLIEDPNILNNSPTQGTKMNALPPFLLGCAILIHPFTGGVFVLVGFIFYYLYFWYQTKSFRKILPVLYGIAIPLGLYFFGFPFPGILNRITGTSPSSGEPSIPSDTPTLPLTFQWNLQKSIDILTYFPAAIWVYIIAIIGLFFLKSHKSLIPLILGIISTSLFYTFNPIVINGVPLIDTFHAYYHIDRASFALSIGVTFLTGFAISGIQQHVEKWYNARLMKKALQTDRENYLAGKVQPPEIQLAALIMVGFLIYQGAITLDPNRSAIGVWSNNIPGDYSETLLWANYKLSPGVSLVTSEITWSYPDFFIYNYYNATIPNLKIIRNDTFYMIEPLNQSILEQQLTEIQLTLYDYIVLDQTGRSRYFAAIEQGYIISVFNSSNAQFFLFQIANNNF